MLQKPGKLLEGLQRHTKGQGNFTNRKLSHLSKNERLFLLGECAKETREAAPWTYTAARGKLRRNRKKDRDFCNLHAASQICGLSLSHPKPQTQYKHGRKSGHCAGGNKSELCGMQPVTGVTNNDCDIRNLFRSAPNDQISEIRKLIVRRVFADQRTYKDS